MKLLVDECCEFELVYALRDAGHNVLYASEELQGATDSELLQRANSEERVLVTEDKDFGELVFRLKRTASGIILLRFEFADRPIKFSRLLAVLKEDEDRLGRSFTVIEANKTRWRTL